MFKRLSIALLALIVLAGCSGDAQIQSPRNEALFSIEGTTVTETDLFNVMNINDAGGVILTRAQEIILDKLVPDDETFQTAVAEELEATKAQYGDLWETILQYYGFSTDEEYVEEVIKPQIQMKLALTDAMTNDFENMIADLYVRKAAVLQVSKDDAADALAALEAGTSWEDVVKEYAIDGNSYVGTPTIYTKNSDIDNTALSHIISTTENGISDAIEIPSDSTKQFIINTIEVNPENIKQEIIDTFIIDSDFQTQYISKLLRENNFKVFDKTLHDAISTDYPDALAN